MNAYDVMDGLLRTSLVIEDTSDEVVIVEAGDLPPPSNMEVELSLIEEGDPALLGLWYECVGGSVIFEQDGGLPLWLTEGTIFERDESDIRSEIARHEKALRAVQASDKPSYSFTRKSSKLDPETGEPGGEEEVTRSRDEHIQHLQRRLAGLHKELGKPSGGEKPFPKGRVRAMPATRAIEPHGFGVTRHEPVRTALDKARAAARSRFLGIQDEPKSREKASAPSPDEPPSDDPTSASHVPLFSEPGERGLAHRGKVTPVPYTKKELKAAEKEGRTLPKRVVRALPGQTITKGTGRLGQRFPTTQAMGTTRDEPKKMAARSAADAKKAKEKLPRTKSMFRTSPPAGASKDWVAPHKKPWAIHAMMHTIAGVKNPHNLTPGQKSAIDALVQSHGHHMGIVDPKALTRTGGESERAVSAKDRATATFLGVYGGEQARTTNVPYHGIIKVAKTYVGGKGNDDPHSAPDDAHDQVAKIVRDARREFSGYHHKEVKERTAAGHVPKSLSVTGKEGEEKERGDVRGHVSAELGKRTADDDVEGAVSAKPLYRGAGTRGTEHMTRAQRFARVHELLGGRYDPEHAERLRSHFDRHDAKTRLGEHNEALRDINEKLKGAVGASKAALLKEKKFHTAARNTEGKRFAAADGLRTNVQGQIARQQAAIESMKRRHKKGGLDAAHTKSHPHMVAMQARLKQLHNLHSEIENPEGHEKYRIHAHILHAGIGGHGDYGIERGAEGEETEKTEWVSSLFDAIFEADASETDPQESKPKKPKKPRAAPGSITVPGEIGASDMPKKWKGAIAQHLGVDPSAISRALGDLFKGEGGEDFTRYVIGTGEHHGSMTRTPGEKGMFLRAAREGKLMHGGAGELAKSAWMARREGKARAHLGRIINAPSPTSSSVPARTPTIQLTPAQQERKEAAAKKAGEEHKQFAALAGRLTPEEAAEAKKKSAGYEKMTPEEKAQRLADAAARRKQRNIDKAAAAEEKRRSELAHAGMTPPGLEPEVEGKKGKKGSEEESLSLFGAVFAESAPRASLFETIFA